MARVHSAKPGCNSLPTELVAVEVDRSGFAMPDDTLTGRQLKYALGIYNQVAGVRPDARRRRIYLSAGLLRAVPEVRRLAELPLVRRLVAAVLGPKAFVVRGLVFDKRLDDNWALPWHQDLAIAVREQVRARGFRGWSVSRGAIQVQPPPSVQQRMLTVRFHLDACPASHGALRVIPGSHRLGQLTDRQIASHTRSHPGRICEAAQGGLLLFRPLLLHSSLLSRSGRPRRTIHLEFAAGPLPGGLRWAGQRA